MNTHNFSSFVPSLKARAAAIALATASAGIVTGLAVASVTAVPAQASLALNDVRTALALRLPNTPIGSLNCKGFGGLCEVVSKQTLFYIDETARYLFVGRLYDMETRSDVTAARLLELNPDMLVVGAPNAAPRDNESPARAAQKVSLAGLSSKGAVRWGRIGGPRLVVFSDFHCGYCKKLSAELAAAGVEVEERPISIFGATSRALSEKVICAADRVKALHQAYAGKTPEARANCMSKGLDENEAFARKHGFSGTPVIVRASDGAVLEGYRSAPQLRVFAKGGR